MLEQLIYLNVPEFDKILSESDFKIFFSLWSAEKKIVEVHSEGKIIFKEKIIRSNEPQNVNSVQ
jgi:hypothetical protein